MGEMGEGIGGGGTQIGGARLVMGGAQVGDARLFVGESSSLRS